MAYDAEKLSRVKHLKELAQRVAEDFATKQSVTDLSKRVDDLTTVGGEPNVITAVKVNGEALPVTDKAVDVGAAIGAAVAAANHLTCKKVENLAAIDPAAEGADKYLYLVPKTDAEGDDLYDEYMVLDGKVEHVGNTKVDLSGYQPKEDGKGLSANDYTDEDKAKLTGLEVATDAEVTEMLNEVFGEKTA